MAETMTLTIDGKQIEGQAGQTIMQAADAAGVYIPRLCYFEDVPPHGSCRLCAVRVSGGKLQAACTQPIAPEMVVENDTEEINKFRRDVVDMLFVEGNHYCMFCEKSGNCELQAAAYRLGITAPKYPFQHPKREVDASHPDVLLDRDRCILCGRCVQASRDLDGKRVFEFVGRGPDTTIAVNAEARLADTDLDESDKAVDCCPVGAILKKHVGYAVPIGRRLYDHEPIGSDIEASASKPGDSSKGAQ